MSEFSSGILFLRDNQNFARDAVVNLGQPYLFRELNTRWSALFPENMNIRQGTLWTWLINHSRRLAMLHFEYAEDHGWSYHLMAGGMPVASVDVNFEIDYQLWLDLVEFRYPHIRDPHSDLDQTTTNALYDEIRGSETYHTSIANQFQSANAAELKIFGLTDESIVELRQLLAADRYLNGPHEQVYAFMRIVGITEFEWMSYRYLSKEP